MFGWLLVRTFSPGIPEDVLVNSTLQGLPTEVL